MYSTKVAHMSRTIYVSVFSYYNWLQMYTNASFIEIE